MIFRGTRIYVSVNHRLTRENDTVVKSFNIPIEFLDGLEPPGLPPHKLNLKVHNTYLRSYIIM